VTTPEPLPDEITALQAALIAERERAARIDAELAIAKARASEDEALIAHQRLQIAKLTRQLYGPRSERSVRLLDQMELAFEELAGSATEDEIAAERAVAKTTNVAAFTRKRPARQPFPAHLPRERVVEPAPTACLCCGSARLRKLGEDITETLEIIPRQWKVIQHVREKFTCRDCEKISQAPAPFHVIARGWAGPSLLAMILFEKFGQHQPLNRQAERYTREGVPLSLSTLADQVGACCAALTPLLRRIEAHVFAAQRLHGDDTTVPVLAKGRTDTGRLWTPAFARAGSMSATIGPLADRVRRPRCFITRAIAAASIRKRILPTMPGSCRRTPSAATTSCTRGTANRARLSRRDVGPMPGARSSPWRISLRTPAAKRKAKHWP
jgi:transposase